MRIRSNVLYVAVTIAASVAAATFAAAPASADYLVDKQGNVVYSHFGEGRYADTEKKILALLAQP